MQPTKSFQLVDTNIEKFVKTDEVLNVHNDYTIISMFGKSRVGKSTLMNIFASYLTCQNCNFFEAKEGNKQVTQGIMMKRIDKNAIKRFKSDKDIILLDFRGTDNQDSTKDIDYSIFAYIISDILIISELKQVYNSTLKNLEAVMAFCERLKNAKEIDKESKTLIFRSVDCGKKNTCQLLNNWKDDLLSKQNDQYDTLRTGLTDILYDSNKISIIGTHIPDDDFIQPNKNGQYEFLLDVISEQNTGFEFLCDFIVGSFSNTKKKDKSFENLLTISSSLTHQIVNKDIDYSVLDATGNFHRTQILHYLNDNQKLKIAMKAIAGDGFNAIGELHALYTSLTNYVNSFYQAFNSKVSHDILIEFVNKELKEVNNFYDEQAVVGISKILQILENAVFTKQILENVGTAPVNSLWIADHVATVLLKDQLNESVVEFVKNKIVPVIAVNLRVYGIQCQEHYQHSYKNMGLKKLQEVGGRVMSEFNFEKTINREVISFGEKIFDFFGLLKNKTIDSEYEEIYSDIESKILRKLENVDAPIDNIVYHDVRAIAFFSYELSPRKIEIADNYNTITNHSLRFLTLKSKAYKIPVPTYSCSTYKWKDIVSKFVRCQEFKFWDCCLVKVGLKREIYTKCDEILKIKDAIRRDEKLNSTNVTGRFNFYGQSVSLDSFVLKILFRIGICHITDNSSIFEQFNGKHSEYKVFFSDQILKLLINNDKLFEKMKTADSIYIELVIRNCAKLQRFLEHVTSNALELSKNTLVQYLTSSTA